MPNKQKSYEKSPRKVFIRTFGWPYVPALQYASLVLSNALAIATKGTARFRLLNVGSSGLRGW